MGEENIRKYNRREVLEVAKEKGSIGVDCVSYAGLQKKERCCLDTRLVFTEKNT